jgi:hypothetical protein
MWTLGINRVNSIEPTASRYGERIQKKVDSVATSATTYRLGSLNDVN